MSVVNILTMSPTIVMRFGASQRGVLLTNQFHHGCKYLSENSCEVSTKLMKMVSN